MRPLRNIFCELEKDDSDMTKRIRLDPVLTKDVQVTPCCLHAVRRALLCLDIPYA